MSRLSRFFQIRRPQKIAALLLAAFLAQSLYMAKVVPLSEQETHTVFAARRLWSHTPALNSPSNSPAGSDESILALWAAGVLPKLQQRLGAGRDVMRIYAAPSRMLVRLPFVGFGLWLAAGLWWVARRLYGNHGGYVALALFCFSFPMVLYSATARSDILVAWGTFGIIFTAIGVAHTLYAPARMWRVRIVILGVALGLTAAANLLAAIIAGILALAFLLYLAPGRRLVGIAALAASGFIGALVLWFCYRFPNELANAHFNAELDTKVLAQFAAQPGSWIFLAAFALSILVYLGWRRARYFGNTAPLIVACLFMLLLPGGGIDGYGSMLHTPLWAIPFACVFIGGIFADLTENAFFGARYRKYVLGVEGLILAGNAVLCLLALLQKTRLA